MWTHPCNDGCNMLPSDWPRASCGLVGSSNLHPDCMTEVSGMDIQTRRAVDGEPKTHGETTHPVPPNEPHPTHGGSNGNEEQTKGLDAQDGDRKAPLELIIRFLRAVMDRDFRAAGKLCQMILIYEPGNPEASEFLPLIHKKLLEEQETEQCPEDDEDDEDDDGDEEDDDGDEEDNDDSDSTSEEDSSQSSSRSTSCSPSDDDDDDDDDEDEEEEEEKHVSRHKLCPSSDISP